MAHTEGSQAEVQLPFDFKDADAQNGLGEVEEVSEAKFTDASEGWTTIDSFGSTVCKSSSDDAEQARDAFGMLESIDTNVAEENSATNVTANDAKAALEYSRDNSTEVAISCAGPLPVTVALSPVDVPAIAPPRDASRFICDGDGKPIQGIRYHCLEYVLFSPLFWSSNSSFSSVACPCYDLCESYRLGAHDLDHRMFEMRKSTVHILVTRCFSLCFP